MTAERSTSDSSVVWRSSVAAISLLLVLQLGLAYRDAINFPFSDHVDLFFPYFAGFDLGQFFFQQHGPHRQGVGPLLMYPVLIASDWDFRVLSYLAVAINGLAAFVFLKCLMFLRVCLATALLCIAVLLSLLSFELITITPNISHSTLPLLFACMVFRSIAQRGFSSALEELPVFIIVVLAMFTGFGIFIFLAYQCVLILRISRSRYVAGKWEISSTTPIGYLLISILVLMSFFYDYRFGGTGGCNAAELSDWASVLEFGAAMFGVVPALDVMPTVVVSTGAVGFLFLLATLGFCIYEYFRGGAALPLASAFFIFLSLGFVAIATVGRHCMDGTAGPASRYFILSTLGYVGAVVVLDRYGPLWLKDRLNIWFAGVTIIALLVGSYLGQYGSAHWRTHKELFLSCVERGQSIETCSSEYYVHPSPQRLRSFLAELAQARASDR